MPDLTYSCPEIMFYLVTPNYIVPKPTLYDKKDPWGLIEAYHYVFYKNDFDISIKNYHEYLRYSHFPAPNTLYKKLYQYSYRYLIT